MYPVSYLFMALAGPFIFIPSMNLANAFPRRSGLILSLLTGAFDSSPAVFLAYRLLYQSALGPISLRNWFMTYLVVPLFIFLVQIFLMPTQSYKATSEHQSETEYATIQGEGQTARGSGSRRDASPVSETDTLLGKSDHHNEAEARNKGIYGAMDGKDIKKQLSSFWFWGITGFTVVQMVCILPPFYTRQPSVYHLIYEIYRS